jgi:hypothetical protein
MNVEWVAASGAKRSEALVGTGELAGPGPVLGETEDDLPSSMHDAGSGVQEPEAQRLGFGSGQLSVQAGQSKPRQQVGAGQHQLEPALVGP